MAIFTKLRKLERSIAKASRKKKGLTGGIINQPLGRSSKAFRSSAKAQAKEVHGKLKNLHTKMNAAGYSKVRQKAEAGIYLAQTRAWGAKVKDTAKKIRRVELKTGKFKLQTKLAVKRGIIVSPAAFLIGYGAYKGGKAVKSDYQKYKKGRKR